jgi:Flp pilus assembly protein TadD
LLTDGRARENEGDWDAAEVAYRAAINSDPTAAEPLINLGLLLEKRGHTKGALTAYAHADVLGAAGAAVNLGILLADREELSPAEEAFKRAVRRGSRHGLFNLGLLRLRRARTRPSSSSVSSPTSTTSWRRSASPSGSTPTRANGRLSRR